MKTEDKKIKRTEHISFYCSPKLKKRIVAVSEEVKESLSWTVRKLILVGFKKREEEGVLEHEQ